MRESQHQIFTGAMLSVQIRGCEPSTGASGVRARGPGTGALLQSAPSNFPGRPPPTTPAGNTEAPGGHRDCPELPASWEEPEPRGTALPRRPPAPATSPPCPVRRPPALTDGDGGHDEGVPEEERGGLGGEVAAEILKEQVLLGLLLGGAAFGSHGGAGVESEEGPTPREAQPGASGPAPAAA